MLRKKLNSKRGVTLLLALLLFLICALVGSVVVSAAYTSAGRYVRNKDSQQSYLAVMSAARLIEECVTDMSYEAAYVKIVEEVTQPQYGLIPLKDEDGNNVLDENGEIVYVEGITGYVTSEFVSYELDLPNLVNNRLFEQEFIDKLDICYQYHHTPDEVYSGAPPVDYASDISVNSDELGIPKVVGQMCLSCDDNADEGNSHFDIVVKLWEESGANAVTMKFPCRVTPTHELSTESGDNWNISYFTYGIEVEWLSPTVRKGGAE